MKKYVVTLTAEERDELTGLIAAGKAAAQKLAHARILLKADTADGGPGCTDDRIAEAVEVNTDTVGRVRQRFVESGLTAALTRKAQAKRSRERVLDVAAEARLITLACSPPPDERTRWTLRMLADKLVELEVVPAVSAETVRRVMKNRGQAAPEGEVVPAGRPEWGVRGPDGGRARGVPPAAGPEAAAGLHRRVVQATGERGP